MDYQYNQRAQQNREKAASQIAQRCAVPFAPADIVGMCLVDEIESHRNQAVSDQDLEAQQRMARWTAVMGVVGVIGIPLSALGLFALWLSLRQTRQAIATDREVGHAQVRAYVTIDAVFKGITGKTKSVEADLQFLNTGQSWAKNFSYVAGVFIDDFPLERDGDLIAGFIEGRAPSLFIPAGKYVTGDAKPKEPFSAEDIKLSVTGGPKRIYVVCIARYEDVFKQRHTTRFCAYLDRVKELPGREGSSAGLYGLVFTRQHNDAD